MAYVANAIYSHRVLLHLGLSPDSCYQSRWGELQAGISLCWLVVQALDVAGTYGVLSLFGILPAASAWSQRYGKDSSFAGIRAVPGEKAMVIMVGCAAGGVILNQAVTSLWGGRG